MLTWFFLPVRFRGRSRIAIGWASMRWDSAVFHRPVPLPDTAMLEFLLATAAWLGVTRIIAHFAKTVLAGYAILLRLIHFAMLLSGG